MNWKFAIANAIDKSIIHHFQLLAIGKMSILTFCIRLSLVNNGKEQMIKNQFTLLQQTKKKNMSLVFRFKVRH